MGSKMVVKVLLKHHANTRLANHEGKVPIHLACEREFTDVCRLLYEADPCCADIKDKDGKVARDYVRVSMNVELYRMFPRYTLFQSKASYYY